MPAKKCIFCGKPSTLLCDFVMGFDGKPGDIPTMRGLNLYRCDAALCSNCATNQGRLFWHGEAGGGCDTIDHCPNHPPEGIEWMRRPMGSSEAERLRYRHRCQSGPGLALIRGGGQLNLFGGEA